MNIFQSLFLGITQGISEFLPISSSGHLAILQHIFNIKEGNLFFSEMLHFGTLKQNKEDEKELPAFCEGEIIESVPVKVTEHDTLPPKAYTESTLLSSMERAGNKEITEDAERKGLGTPATRAGVIEKIIKAGFVTRKGKQLLPTKDGMNLISVLPETLTSTLLTAEWENELSRIAKGETDADSFMERIEALTKDLVKNADAEKVKSELFKKEKTVIGLCPRCKSPVYEGKKNYYCSNRDCRFSMWKKMCVLQQWSSFRSR